MMHMRVWRTMTMATVEITCYHGQGQQDGSHLVFRMSDEIGDSPVDLLDFVQYATGYAYDEARQDRLPGLVDECGWV